MTVILYSGLSRDYCDILIPFIHPSFPPHLPSYPPLDQTIKHAGRISYDLVYAVTVDGRHGDGGDTVPPPVLVPAGMLDLTGLNLVHVRGELGELVPSDLGVLVGLCRDDEPRLCADGW